MLPFISLEGPLPDRDTVHLRRQRADSGSDGGTDETALLGPPKRKRPRDRRSTVIDLRGGKRRERETRPDMSVATITDTRTGAEREETPPPAPKRRRRLRIGTGAPAAVEDGGGDTGSSGEQVPNPYRVPVAEAKADLNARGFDNVVTQQHMSKEGDGGLDGCDVVMQDPSAGTMADYGDTLALTYHAFATHLCWWPGISIDRRRPLHCRVGPRGAHGSAAPASCSRRRRSGRLRPGRAGSIRPRTGGTANSARRGSRPRPRPRRAARRARRPARRWRWRAPPR